MTDIERRRAAEDALDRSEEIFRTVIDSIEDYAIFALDPEGYILTWNAGAQRIKGYLASEIIGQHFSKFYTPEDLARKHPEEELVQAERDGRYEEEGWRIRKDGTKFWASVVITALKTADGELRGFAKVTRDLSKKRENEEALKSSEAFLSSVVENIPLMVFVKDAETLRFVRFNKAGARLLGYSQGWLLGKSDFDVFPHEIATELQRKDREVLRQVSIVEIAEEVVPTPEGPRFLRTRKIPVLGPQGRPTYLLGISEDITEIKKEEEQRLKRAREEAALSERIRENERITFLAEVSTALASSLDYRKSFVELARLSVPVLADWCTVTIVREDRTKERVAIFHKDANKKNLVDELSSYYPQSANENAGIGWVINSGSPIFMPQVQESDLMASAKDRRHLDLMRSLGCSSCMVVPILARGRVLGAISFVYDLREYDKNDLACAEELGRRAGIAIDNAYLLEATQKAVRVRDDFLSIASHELKTPLTSLKLKTQMRRINLKKGNLDMFSRENLPRLIEDDERQVNRLSRLVDDILDISTLNSGKLSLDLESTEMNALVKEVVERFQPQTENAGISVEVRYGLKTQSCAGLWDRTRIEQVVGNLLSNAIKYGQDKPIVIDVAAEGEMVRVSVKDRGLGIAEEDRHRIFEQFERAVTPNSASGLGLGLYIVRQIVEAHKGRVGLESVLGEGSTFSIWLPRDLKVTA